MYGCEIMPISDKQIEMFETAHRFVARRIQHLSEKSPTVICLASLGWWTLESYIDKENLCTFASYWITKPQIYIVQWKFITMFQKALPYSPVVQIYNVCQKHGLLDKVITWLCEWVVPTRSEWNTLVNNVINYREFCRWRSLCLMYKRLDLFLSVVTKPQLCI